MNSDLSLVNWEVFVYCQVRANEIYSEAKRHFSDRNMGRNECPVPS